MKLTVVAPVWNTQTNNQTFIYISLFYHTYMHDDKKRYANRLFVQWEQTMFLILIAIQNGWFFFFLFIFIFFLLFSYSNTNNDDMVTLELLGSENFMRHNFLNIQKSNLWLNDYFHIFIIYKISNEHFRPDISFLKWKRICWILFEDFFYLFLLFSFFCRNLSRIN